MLTGRFERPGNSRAPGVAYWRAIALLLCLKAVGLTLLYVLFFAPADRPAVTEQLVARHLLARPASPTGDEVNHDR
jgi:hypothetical protein